jgi:hypothetical protein
MLKAVMPFTKEPIFDSPRIDLYGPFWIMCTLIVIIGIVSHFSEWVDSLIDGDVVETIDINRVASCASLLFSYWIGVPLFLHIIFKCSTVKKKGAPGFMRFLAVYGYSMTIFIPAAIGYIFPLELSRWIILIVAGVISLFFICKELISAATENLTGEKLKLVSIAVACLHGGLIILLRFYYFA